MKVLVTGCGFLSYNLANLLLKNGHHIHFLVKSMNLRLEELRNRFSSRVSVSPSRFEELIAVSKSSRFDAVVHLSTNYGRSNPRLHNDVSQIVYDNLVFPIQLLRIVNEVEIPLFINTDSYFNKDGLNYKKLLDYSLTKKSFNMWLSDSTLDTVVCTLRLEHAYGLYDKPEKFVSQAVSEIVVKQSPFFEATSGFQARDFVNVADIARAYLAVLECQSIESLNYQIFEIGSGTGTAIRDFLSLISHFSGSKTEISFGALDLTDDGYDSFANLYNISQLGWVPTVSLERGLQELVSAAQRGKPWLF